MENKKVILQPIEPAIQRFLDMPDGVLKNIMYYKEMRNRNAFYCDYKVEDGYQYFGYTMYTLKKTAHSYFLKVKNRHGFTVDPKGKLKIWFGKSPREINYITALFVDVFKYTWFNKYHDAFLTKGLLEKLLTGKITNSIDFFNAWYKAMKIKGNGKYLAKLIDNNHDGGPEGLRRTILRFSQVMTDMDHAVQKLLKDHMFWYDNHMEDIIQQATILNKKINPNWSDKRLAEEHTNMTREIMEYEIKDMEQEIIPYKEEARAIMSGFPGVTLLDTKAKVFAEGKVMSHCIYSNYYNRIKHGEFLAFNVEGKNKSGTLTLKCELNLKTKVYEYKINAFLGKRNSAMDEETEQIANFLIVYLSANLPLKGDFIDSLYAEHPFHDYRPTRSYVYGEAEAAYLPF